MAPFPLKGADGVVRSRSTIIGGLNEPPRLRPLRRLRKHFLLGASTPPLPRSGVACLQRSATGSTKEGLCSPQPTVTNLDLVDSASMSFSPSAERSTHR